MKLVRTQRTRWKKKEWKHKQTKQKGGEKGQCSRREKGRATHWLRRTEPLPSSHTARNSVTACHERAAVGRAVTFQAGGERVRACGAERHLRWR
jgi:hypothetical protein